MSKTMLFVFLFVSMSSSAFAGRLSIAMQHAGALAIACDILETCAEDSLTDFDKDLLQNYNIGKGSEGEIAEFCSNIKRTRDPDVQEVLHAKKIILGDLKKSPQGASCLFAKKR